MPRVSKKMFKSQSPDLEIREYFREVRSKYPDLTLVDFEKVIKSAFSFFRAIMGSDNFQTINIKYFGKFIPFRNYERKQNEEAKIAFEKLNKDKKHNSLPPGEV